MPVGESLTLHIAASSGESMEFSGRVAYILEGFGFGVEFVDQTDAQRGFINKLVTAASS